MAFDKSIIARRSELVNMRRNISRIFYNYKAIKCKPITKCANAMVNTSMKFKLFAALCRALNGTKTC